MTRADSVVIIFPSHSHAGLQALQRAKFYFSGLGKLDGFVLCFTKGLGKRLLIVCDRNIGGKREFWVSSFPFSSSITEMNRRRLNLFKQFRFFRRHFLSFLQPGQIGRSNCFLKLFNFEDLSLCLWFTRFYAPFGCHAHLGMEWLEWDLLFARLFPGCCKTRR